MNTFYFNTGVKLPNVCHAKGAILSSNDVYTIPFECEAPKGATFLFACNTADLTDGICYEIKQPSSLLSKFAYFKV